MTIGSMVEALEKTLAELDLTKVDSAQVELARWYARQLDSAPLTLGEIGPKFRLILSDLRVTITPKGGVQSDDDSSDSGDFLAEVRQLHPGQHSS